MWKVCEENQNEIIEMRRELHKIPELGTKLPKTLEFVANKLTEYGIGFVTSSKDGGIVAEISGNKNGKVLAMRADMDALPIQEEVEVEYKSIHQGNMHACGHDAHTAMLLYAAKILKENEKSINGTVRFLFQTGEENAKGAKALIEEGAVDGVDAVFGMHIGSILGTQYEAGKFIATPGCVMAAMDKFIVNVTGKGCHGSTPEKGIDPINIVSHIIIGLQAIIARETDATKPVVISFGKIEGGTIFNAIPDAIMLEGTIRTTSVAERTRVVKRMKEVVEGTAMTFGGTATLEIDQGTVPLINDEKMANLAVEVAREIVGEEMTVDKVDAPNMGGEDFSYFVQKVPGAFLFLSSVNPRIGSDVPHHNAKFKVDEAVLWEGSAFFVLLAQRFFEGE